jgi:hypothetical protein
MEAHSLKPSQQHTCSIQVHAQVARSTAAPQLPLLPASLVQQQLVAAGEAQELQASGSGDVLQAGQAGCGAAGRTRSGDS